MLAITIGLEGEVRCLRGTGDRNTGDRTQATATQATATNVTSVHGRRLRGDLTRMEAVS